MVARAFLLTLAVGCSSPDRGSSPERAVELLIEAARTGDRAAVYARLGPATRGRIETLQVDSRKLTGRLALKEEDFLSVGWAPPTWEPASMRTVRRDAQTADVEVVSAAGDRHTVTLVHEGDEWRVELPGR